MLSRRQALITLPLLLTGVHVLSAQDAPLPPGVHPKLTMTFGDAEEVVILRRSPFDPYVDQEIRIPVEDIWNALSRTADARPVE